MLLGPVRIEEWRPRAKGAGADLDSLAGVLHAAVHAGASVSFVLPFSLADARAFWREKVLPGVEDGKRVVLLARNGGEIVGTAQLILDTPPNQQHRAEVAKLLVLPKARRRGVGRALMSAIENVAQREMRTLITLDTRTGDMAEPLYLSMGYVAAGIIPRYAIDPRGQKLEPTTILYKELAADERR
jgi:ribosomal protein S18 acetylase RimI-like enzyme